LKKKKRIAAWCCCIVAALLLVILAGGWYMFGEDIIAANSITELEDGLYAMEYRGDYGFDEFLKHGGAKSDSDVAEFLASYLSHGFYHVDAQVETKAAGCSTICTETADGRVLFGRNFDWAECSAMIVHTKPQNGYESISTCCLDFLGFGENYVPDSSMMNRIQALAAIYVPLDGMNEKGLMVADLIAGDDEETHQDTGKTGLTTTTMIRLLLDHAADVEEAVELMQQYDMNSSMTSAHHLAIADASGNSIVVEYVNGEMLITQTNIVTNHYLSDCPKQGRGSEQSHLRFDTLSAWESPSDEFGVREMLEAVSQKNYPQTDGSYERTMWSIVYIPDGLCADFWFAEDYTHSYGMLLLDKGSAFVKK